jgi:hypothetical protein
MMPFRLKNVGRYIPKMHVTLLRGTYRTHHRGLRRRYRGQVEKTSDLVPDLTEVFAKLRQHGVKLNPEKCDFGVPRGMLFGFVMSERGVEANPKNISAITDMGPIQHLKGVQRVKRIQTFTSKHLFNL